MASSRLLTWGAVGSSVGGVLLAAAFVSIVVVGITVAGTRVLFISTMALIFAFVGIQEALRVRPEFDSFGGVVRARWSCSVGSGRSGATSVLRSRRCSGK